MSLFDWCSINCFENFPKQLKKTNAAQLTFVYSSSATCGNGRKICILLTQKGYRVVAMARDISRDTQKAIKQLI
jgi:hypothetical protein